MSVDDTYGRRAIPACKRITRAWAFSLFAALFLCGTGARADQPEEVVLAQYSKYERDVIKSALGELEASIDPAPDGKLIEQVDIVRLEVFDERDRALRFFNVFHATSLDRVIRRELLIDEGDAYRSDLVDETARNLRALSQLSLVLTVPLKGSSPDRARLLVITKDVWSLRLNFDLGLGPGGLERLLVQPSERNVGGLHQTILTRVYYLPESISFGIGARMPRVQGLRLTVTADAIGIVNQRSGKLEGSAGGMTVSRPLFSTRTEWAWTAGFSWADEVLRRYVNAKVAGFDADVTPDRDNIPFQYRSRKIVESASVTRSFGVRYKHNFSVGGELNRRVYSVPGLGAYNPDAVNEFRRTEVPTSDSRVGPFVQYHAYKNEYLRILDFETLGLQEDYRLGHDIYVRAYPITRALGSNRDFIGVYAAAQYTQPISDGFVLAAVESTTEAEADRLSDASISGTLRFVTPRLGFGRFVTSGTIIDRYRNYLNVRSYLGGDTRLRGYPSNFFIGDNVFTANFEYRTPALKWDNCLLGFPLACHLGLAGFWDIGQAFNNFARFNPYHSAGLGLRVLFPQFDRIVMRGDVGFPIPIRSLPAGVAPASFFISFGQAFPVETIGPTASLPQ